MNDFLHPRVLETRKHAINPGPTMLRLLPARADSRVLVLWGGSVILEQGGADIMLEGHLIWIAPPSSPLVIKSAAPVKTLLSEIHIKGALAKDYLQSLRRLYGRTMRIPNDPALRRTTQKLLTQGTDSSSQTVFSWLTGLHEAARIRTHNLERLISEGLPMLKSLAPDNDFSLKAIASELGCTTHFLNQRWESRGHPPLVKSLRQLRHDLATRLLRDTALPLRVIAGRCGFSGPPAFLSAFKKNTGLTPQVWRNTQAKNTEPPPKRAPPSEQPEPKPFEEKLHLEQLHGHDERPVSIWGGPFFQFDGGEVDFPYEKPFNLALNRITGAVLWSCTLGGSAQLEIGGRTYTFEPGCVLIQLKPLQARWLTPTGDNWSRVWVQMRDTWSMQLMEHYGRENGWAFRIPLKSKPVKLARTWVERWNAGRGIPSVARSRAAYDWLLSWEELLQSGRCERVDFPDLVPYRLDSFYRKIGTISRYADNMGYSRAYLSRLLRKQWHGGTPSQIVRRHRLAQASLELREGRDPIHEISKRALYSNPSAFIAAFKKEFGMTPLAYRYSDPKATPHHKSKAAPGHVD